MEKVVEMHGICKWFPGVAANDDVSLDLLKGEIHALLGENGAGKSTFVSILFGMYRPDRGKILINGREVKMNNPKDANRLGIGMVHQHFKLISNFTVLQNIILGAETTKFGHLLLKQARKKVLALSERYAFAIDPDAVIETIGVGMQQRVEILKMLYRENDILIFDEPTAVLTPQETDELMHIMRGLAAEGKSILFITHKLNEILAVADRCTVLRKGKYIGTVDVADTTKEMLSEMMVGRKVTLKVEKTDADPGETVLSVENLCVDNKLSHKHLVKNVSLQTRRGEIVGIAGIDGNGQTEFVQAVTGLMPIASGRVRFKGEDITGFSIRKRTRAGISHIPEDRHKHGLILDFPLGYNMVLQSFFEPRFCRNGILQYDSIYQYTDEMIEKYDIRSGQGAETIVRGMSGGNQQKSIIAREIEANPDLLIAVQPTRGLDVGAIEYIHKKLVDERNKGKSILLISLELDEVMSLSDRLFVMYEGEIVAEVDPKHTSVQELGLLMAGNKRNLPREVTV